ncbi:putative f-box domain-containing protein [Daldinia childiae]|uniref:putative f-box domain-containing protein n=1 Tax=Daldinia childiae TaxID=326645 RepID=UPI0014487419|nr:putative f-box domain-containing protein [Daldinia childiae]KAF3058233.1 putative f-box domain-containing protein [Daldinia childiae]
MATSEGSAPAREAAGSSALKKGLELYAQEDYEAAAKLFKKAINSCSCQIHGGMVLDLNEDILTGIENNQLKEVLSTLTPRSRRCDKQVHIRALDSLIATYEMLLKLDKCLNLAVGMVNLAPREPKVYLRLGKILRLKSKQTLAYHMYRQGIELVERKNPNHSLLPKLRVQRDRVATLAAFDPVTKFPIELVRMTFEFLDFKTLCHPGIRRMLPAFKAYNKYGKNALRELSIDGLSHFLQWCKFSQVIEISQQLKVLKLREPRGSFELESLPSKLRLPQLTNLSLGYGVRPRPQVLEQLITACGNSLEELSIFELPHCARLASDQVPWYPGWVKLEKLKVVRLAYPNYELRAGPVPDLRGIMELAPNVEEAWIDDLTYSSKMLMTKWPKLQNIFVGNRARLYTVVGEDDVEGGYNEDMRELHLEGRSAQSRFNKSKPEHKVNDIDSFSYRSRMEKAGIHYQERVLELYYKERVWELPSWVNELLTKLQQPSENTMTEEDMTMRLRYVKLAMGSIEEKMMDTVKLLGRDVFGPSSDGDIPTVSMNTKFRDRFVPNGVITPQPSFTFGYGSSDIPTSLTNSTVSLLATNPSVDFKVNFPYMIVEVEVSADASTHGKENRCLGAAATCLHLNSKLLQGNLAIFAVIVLPVGLAEFFIMWKDGDKCIMKKFRSFALYEYDQHRACQMLWSNIRNWAMNERLKDISRDLEKVSEQGRKRSLLSSEDLMSELGKRQKITADTHSLSR